MGPQWVEVQTWKKWGPEGWGPEGWGAQRVVGPKGREAPKFALFFPLPPPFRSLCLWVSSRGILVVFEMCTFGVLGLSCEAQAAPEATGVSHDNERAQTCTFEGSGLQKHHQNSAKGPTREKRLKTVAGEGKKGAKFWGSSGGGVQRRGGPAEGLGFRFGVEGLGVQCKWDKNRTKRK